MSGGSGGSSQLRADDDVFIRPGSWLTLSRPARMRFVRRRRTNEIGGCSPVEAHATSASWIRSERAQLEANKSPDRRSLGQQQVAAARTMSRHNEEMRLSGLGTDEPATIGRCGRDKRRACVFKWRIRLKANHSLQLLQTSQVGRRPSSAPAVGPQSKLGALQPVSIANPVGLGRRKLRNYLALAATSCFQWPITRKRGGKRASDR